MAAGTIQAINGSSLISAGSATLQASGGTSRIGSAGTALGLAVPGMPVGSPGMEHGDRVDPYQVLLWGDGEERVFAQYGPKVP